MVEYLQSIASGRIGRMSMRRMLRICFIVLVAVVAFWSCALFNTDLFAPAIGTWNATTLTSATTTYTAPADFSDQYVIKNDHTWSQSGQAVGGNALAAGGKWATDGNYYWLSYATSGGASTTYFCELSSDEKTLTITKPNGDVETCRKE
jgi:hypothetical protein